MKKLIVIFSVCVLLLITIPLSACSSNSADIEILKTQIAELQKENSELKSKIDNNSKPESSESSKSESSKAEYDFITVEVINIEKSIKIQITIYSATE